MLSFAFCISCSRKPFVFPLVQTLPLLFVCKENSFSEVAGFAESRKGKGLAM